MSEQNSTNKKMNISPKYRVFGAIVGCLVVAALGFGLYHHMHTVSAYEGSAELSGAPQIASDPGVGKPSEHYVKQQQQQNAAEYKKALSQGTSFVPTITRPSLADVGNGFANDPVDTIVNQAAPKDPQACPLAKVVHMYRPNPANCSVNNLKLARQAGVTASELRCQACSCPALRLAGYTAGELKSTGYGATALKTCGFNLEQLMEAGYDATALKKAGYGAKMLRLAGFSAGQLAAAGFSNGQIKAAGYSEDQLAALKEKAQQDCSVAALRKAHEHHVDAATLKECGVAALHAAGYNASELKAAGFSADALKAAGFSVPDLAKAGFPKAALNSLKQCSVAQLKAARLKGISAVALNDKGCGLAALKAAGFTAAELKAAGFSAKALKAAGFSAPDLAHAGYGAAALKAAGFSAEALKKAGMGADALKAAGFSAAELAKAGYDAAALKKAGFNPSQLRDAGLSAQALRQAGFSAQDLKDAGYNAGQLNAAGYSAKALKKAGFSPAALRDAGVDAAALKAAGFDKKALTAAGYTQGDLLRAGFKPTVAVAPAASVAPATPAPVAKPPVVAAGFPSAEGVGQDARLRQIQRSQQLLMNQQARQDAIAQLQGQMMMEGQKLMAGWGSVTPQVAAVSTVPVNTSAANGGLGAASGKSTASGPVFKAGDVMFAVLDTSVNSDENSPVMASIVAGPLKGAKLVGQFKRVNKRVLLSFNLINMPGFEHSFSANIVAIDPNTARTALSGYVNNHYLLRYGSLFASSFLAGLGDAVSKSGATVINSPLSTVTTYPKLTPTGYALVGLGGVGKQFSSVLAQQFNTPPTIKIPGGTGMGLLFMSDVTLPQPLPEQQPGVAVPTTTQHFLGE